MALFQPAELQRIEDKVAEVEARTAAEIVIVTLPRSDGYLEVRLAFAAAVGLFAASLLHAIWHDISASWLLIAQVGVAGLAWPLSGVPWLLHRMVPGDRAQRAVERAAELSFLEHAVFDTRGRNGVLLLLSELEHRVTMLGDTALHAHLKDAGEVALVQQLTDAIRQGRTADGTCEFVERLGVALSELAPLLSDNPNELGNQVRVRT